VKRCSKCNSLMPDDAPKCIKCGFAMAKPPAPSASPGAAPAKSRIHVSESLWRFLAVAMAFALSWMLWIFYQISPPPLILTSAFEAAAKAKAKQAGAPSAQRVITPPPVTAAAPPAVQAAPVPEKSVQETPVAAKPSDAEVIDAVQAWAKAWSSGDVDAYLAFYARDFKTPRGEPRAEWEKGRRQRIAASKSIVIALDSFKVGFAADDRSTVTFRQNYRSDIVRSDVTTKTLLMAKVDGRWLIQQENAGN